MYPAEIEALLLEHPAVREVAVLGEDHPDLGQQPVAVVVIEPDHSVSEDELVRYAAEHLSYFKVPARWRFTQDPLPRNATGKVLRAAVTV